jgi:hypothetical protein
MFVNRYLILKYNMPFYHQLLLLKNNLPRHPYL